MSNLELLRMELYKAIESEDLEEILRVSRKLDELVLYYTIKQLCKQSA
ncbi:MAG: Spo0E family sporulation regulatory protein-aspartic acid phosphatase [Clostridia bacterium]|nr:Spo0E family sporulation regulatory protein-aspartic acid phosphatase [Clostridia bacterium]